MKKLTPWFPHHIKPSRPGVYATWYGSRLDGTYDIGYSFWSGSQWSNQAASRARVNTTWMQEAEQKKQWRGLAVKP